DRTRHFFEAHYFHSPGKSELAVPAVRVGIEVMKGFEHRLESRTLEVLPNQKSDVIIRLEPMEKPRSPSSRWASGDGQVHMYYGGCYRKTPKRLLDRGGG